MKILDDPTTTEQTRNPVSYGALLEKIEIMRSTLRWPQTLERTQIQKLFNQTNALRDEVLRLSRTERFLTVKTRTSKEPKATYAERRKALLDRQFQFEGVFGDNQRLIESLEIAEKAAPTDLPVLIDGESGTGKELMAKVIHANGDRSDKPFITVNCGAIPDNLLESELFGHKKGAFTGASSDRAGKFESADGGTIFLDEIGELPLNGQVKLLRVLQSNEIQRVGSDQVIKVDARIVAATNLKLLDQCAKGAFREDLYYRLSIIEVTLPPLRERRDEIPVLIEFLSQEAAVRLGRDPIRLAKRLERFLHGYAYPGNVRELRNILFRLTCLAGETADVEHLPEDIRPKGSVPAQGATAPPSTPDTDVSLAEAKRIASDEAEKRFLEAGLLETRGNVTQLAKRIDMNRAHVQTLLKKHGLSSKDYRGTKAAGAGAASSN